MVHLISPEHQNTLYSNTPQLHVIYNSPKESSPRDFMKTHFRYLATYIFSKYYFKCLYKHASISHEIYVDLKKESWAY